MSSAEWSDRSRRLAGVDQALGDGRARAPAELLDQLRERLGRLEPNHPSAYQPPGAERSEPAATEREEASVPDESEPGRQDDAPSADAASGEQPRGGDGIDADQDVSAPAEVGTPGEPGEGPGWPGPGRPGHADPYRPWFMTGDSGPPWFAE